MSDPSASKISSEDLAKRQRELRPGWKVVDGHHLEKEYTFKNFREALAFTNKLGEIAESMNHHPDIFLGWGKVKVTLFTHSAGGLTENDFVFASKVDA